MRNRIQRAAKGAVLLILLWGAGLHTAYGLDVNGRIETDSSWTKEESPVRVTGAVEVLEGATLAIEPGVQVIFQTPPDETRGHVLRVEGTLAARGIETEPILFTAEDPTVRWGGIVFTDTSQDWNRQSESGSIMEYCIVEYGGNQRGGAAMIRLNNANPRIARNAIRFAESEGITVMADPSAASSVGGDMQVISNLIYANTIGLQFQGEGGVIRNNYFLLNDRAINISAASSDVTVIDNTILSSAGVLYGTGLRLVLEKVESGVSSYQWRQTGGPSVELINREGTTAEFDAPDPGNGLANLTFELTVVGDEGQEQTDSVEITVVGDNPPPVAEAGNDRAVQLSDAPGSQTTVTLDASGSSDPYLGIVGYTWRQISGVPVTLGGNDIRRPTFTVPSAVSAGDRMVFELMVVDSEGLTDTDEVEIRYFRDNVYPTASAGADRRVDQGEWVTLDGTGSGDPDGSISSFSWTQIGGPEVALSNRNTARSRFYSPVDNQQPVTLEFRLMVVDSGGLRDSDVVEIVVKGLFTADAGEDRTVSAEERVVLDASGSLDRSAEARIEVASNLIRSDNPEAGLLALTARPGSAFSLDISGNRFQAADQGGVAVYIFNWASKGPETISMPYNDWGTDDPAAVENLIYDQSEDYTLPAVRYEPLTDELPDAGSGLSYPPLAEAGPDMEVTPDASVVLDGTDSYDPDGIARYQWEQIEGPQVDIRDADDAVASFAAPGAGEEGELLRFRLRVAVGPTFYHDDTMAVTVVPVENLPETDVGGCFIQAAGESPEKKGMKSFLFGLFFAAVLCVWFRWRFFPVVKRRWLDMAGLLLVVCLLTAAPVRAGYLSVGGGGGGDAEEVNVTIETGASDIRAYGMDIMFGLGLHLIPHSDDEIPDGTIALPCPNDQCTPLDSVRKGTEVGAIGKLGMEIGASSFYVNVLGGISAYTESELVRSPGTGRVYENDSDSQVDPLYGLGVSYFTGYEWDLVFHLDVDNVRGVTGAVGWHW